MSDSPGRPHVFTIAVSVRMHGADWSSDLEPQTVKAYDLADALRSAAMIPVGKWAAEPSPLEP